MTTSTFRETVALVAANARAKLPEQVNGRIESAVKLVLAHDVTRLADGTIEVGSSSDPMKTYQLVGHTCTCTDFTQGKAPSGWCKHRISAGIDKRVRELLPVAVEPEMVEPWADNDAEEPAPTPPPALEPTIPTPAPLPDAAFSITLKGFVGGQDALLTVRGATAAEFTRNLAAIRGLLDPPAPPASQATGQGEGWCAVHSTAMKWNEGRNGKKGWYSHRHEGQWCKGTRT